MPRLIIALMMIWSFVSMAIDSSIVRQDQINTLTFSNVPSVTCSLQYSDDLQNWLHAKHLPITESGSLVTTVTSSADHRFYRLSTNSSNGGAIVTISPNTDSPLTHAKKITPSENTEKIAELDICLIGGTNSIVDLMSEITFEVLGSTNLALFVNNFSLSFGTNIFTVPAPTNLDGIITFSNLAIPLCEGSPASVTLSVTLDPNSVELTAGQTLIPNLNVTGSRGGSLNNPQVISGIDSNSLETADQTLGFAIQKFTSPKTLPVSGFAVDIEEHYFDWPPIVLVDDILVGMNISTGSESVTIMKDDSSMVLSLVGDQPVNISSTIFASADSVNPADTESFLFIPANTTRRLTAYISVTRDDSLLQVILDRINFINPSDETSFVNIGFGGYKINLPK